MEKADENYKFEIHCFSCQETHQFEYISLKKKDHCYCPKSGKSIIYRIQDLYNEQFPVEVECPFCDTIHQFDLDQLSVILSCPENNKVILRKLGFSADYFSSRYGNDGYPYHI